MKKYFYLAAVSAMMLTACSSDKDVLESTPKPSTPTVVAQQQAVAFDTYLSGTTASTRAGYEGVMTTDKLKKADAGFGVFAYYDDGGSGYNSSLMPNFMFNQQVYWASGWTYSPLKYWPNETTNDSQSSAASSTHTDKLSFFAYAPFTATNTATLTTKSDSWLPIDATPANNKNAWSDGVTTNSGIVAISRENITGDPLVQWRYTANPDKNVDLLWGVAPAGNLSYQDVSKGTTSVTYGWPLLNLVKPDKDQKVKFLFQHALSRIGLSVVTAIDQIDAGGSYNSDHTRVLIKSVQISGKFGTEGVLNLNNTAQNKANWLTTVTDAGTSTLFTIDATNGYLAKDLRYDAGQISAVTGTGDPLAGGDETKFSKLNRGVGTSDTPLLAQGSDPGKQVTDLTYEVGKALYTLEDVASAVDYVRATTTATAAADVFEKDETTGKYTQVAKSSDPAITMDGSKAYYTLSVTTKTVAAASSTNELVAGKKYYTTLTGTVAGGNAVYDGEITATSTPADGTYYEIAETPVAGNPYSSTQGYPFYSSLMPRYFMVVPTGNTPVKVKIVYAVVTKDTNLYGNISNVQNDITKETTINLENGKSYNLKLILGLTSVKLDATVADWKVADDSEIYLPQNVQ